MNHQQDFIDCVRTRSQPIADVEIGHCSATVCHLGYITNYLGRPLDWDPQSELCANDPEANRMLMKAYREPYSL